MAIADRRVPAARIATRAALAPTVRTEAAAIGRIARTEAAAIDRIVPIAASAAIVLTGPTAAVLIAATVDRGRTAGLKVIVPIAIGAPARHRRSSVAAPRRPAPTAARAIQDATARIARASRARAKVRHAAFPSPRKHRSDAYARSSRRTSRRP